MKTSEKIKKLAKNLEEVIKTYNKKDVVLNSNEQQILLTGENTVAGINNRFISEKQYAQITVLYNFMKTHPIENMQEFENYIKNSNRTEFRYVKELLGIIPSFLERLTLADSPRGFALEYVSHKVNDPVAARFKENKENAEDDEECEDDCEVALD